MIPFHHLLGASFTLALCVWSASVRLETRRIYADIEATKVYVGMEPAEEYYGPRHVRTPCCHVIHQLR